MNLEVNESPPKRAQPSAGLLLVGESNMKSIVSVLLLGFLAYAAVAEKREEALQPVEQTWHSRVGSLPALRKAVTVLKNKQELSALEEEEKAVVIATVVLAIIGVYASAGSQAANANREFTVQDARGEMYDAQRNTKAVLDAIAEINAEFKRDYAENAKKFGILDTIKQAGTGVKASADTEQTLSSLAHQAMVEDFMKLMKKSSKHHTSETGSELVLDQSIDVGLKVGAAMSTAIHHAEPFIGAALTLLSVGGAVAGLATDNAAMYAESDKEQTVAMLQRTKDAATLTSCRYWSTIYTALSQSEESKGADKAKVQEFITHLLSQLKKIWRCQCTQLSHTAETRDFGEDIVTLTVHRGRSPAENELNPEEPDGTQPTVAKSVSLVPVKRKACTTLACKKKPPIVDIVVTHRTCGKAEEETVFEKRIKAMGFEPAAVNGYDSIPPEAQADVCHTKVHGDTNVGQPDRYMVQQVYVKAGWGPPPITDVKVMYGATDPTADYFRVPMSTNAVEATWSSSMGRLVGYYSRRDAFIEFKTGYSRAPCPQTTTKQDEAWCSDKMSASTRSAQCQYHNWKLQGTYSVGFTWGVTKCLADRKKSVFSEDVPLFPCAREYLAKKKTSTPLDLTWAAGCRVGCDEVFFRTFSRSGMGLSSISAESFSMVAPPSGLESAVTTAQSEVDRVQTELDEEAALEKKMKAWLAKDMKVKLQVGSQTKELTKPPQTTISAVALEAAKLVTPPITDVNTFVKKYLCFYMPYEDAVGANFLSKFEDHGQPIIEFSRAPTKTTEGSAGFHMRCDPRDEKAFKTAHTKASLQGHT